MFRSLALYIRFFWLGPAKRVRLSSLSRTLERKLSRIWFVTPCSLTRFSSKGPIALFRGLLTSSSPSPPTPSFSSLLPFFLSTPYSPPTYTLSALKVMLAISAALSVLLASVVSAQTTASALDIEVEQVSSKKLLLVSFSPSLFSRVWPLLACEHVY